MSEIITIGDIDVARGERMQIDLPVADLYNGARLHMPVEVIRGRRDGPVLFVSAAVHGDEINGVEVIRRLLQLSLLKKLRGTLIAVPVVNVYGFLNLSRYLPDRRDLNRSFPGSERGSVAGRLAWIFNQEIVSKSDCGIDLHTGAIHRSNLPQIRANLDDPETLRMARAFGTPVMINANLRDGSLRECAAEQGIPMLLYEAGEALRFDETSIRAGVRGVINVMRELGMLPARKSKSVEAVTARSSSWVRAGKSGILTTHVAIGDRVEKNGLLAKIADPFGQNAAELRSDVRGLVIGRTNLPLVTEGDAIFHIARFESAAEAGAKVELFQEVHDIKTELDSDRPVV